MGWFDHQSYLIRRGWEILREGESRAPTKLVKMVFPGFGEHLNGIFKGVWILKEWMWSSFTQNPFQLARSEPLRDVVFGASFFFGAFQDPWKLRFAAFVWVAWMIGFSLLNRQELTMRNRGLLAYIYYHICFYIWNINFTVFLHNFQEIPSKKPGRHGWWNVGMPALGFNPRVLCEACWKKNTYSIP